MSKWQSERSIHEMLKDTPPIRESSDSITSGTEPKFPTSRSMPFPPAYDYVITIPTAPLTAMEKRERKRLAEIKRRTKIKNNTELHNKDKEKARERYYRRKAEGIIIPVSEMSAQNKLAVREQNRLKSRRFRQRKKERENRALKEDNMILCPDSPNFVEDPLCPNS